MNKILKGIMKYRHTDRATMVEQFKQVKNNPHPKAVFFTCMDSRMIPTRFTETCVGDMFVVRNAGNLIPHSRNYPDEVTTTEPAALELGCVVNNIRHVIVCGHSDCKAMNLLYSLRCQDTSSLDNRRISPLKAWMCAHATSSLEKYKHLLQFGFDTPMVFEAETPQRQFVAYIDPENKFATEDKLSQADGRTMDGTVSMSGGGVGRNIADALSRLGVSTHLISAIGKDQFGDFITKETISHLDGYHLATGDERTPICVVVCDNDGNSRLIVGDMNAHRLIDVEALKSAQDRIINSSLIAFDGNIPPTTLQYILQLSHQHNIPVFFEPTDIVRARIPFQILKAHPIAFASPNIAEFWEIVEEVLPNFQVNDKNNLEALADAASHLVDKFILNLIITLGPQGLLIARRGSKGAFFSERKLIAHTGPVTSHIYKPEVITSANIVNVSGAGDCFASGFIASMLRGDNEEDCVKQGFLASQAALQSSKTVPDNLHFH